MEKELLNAVYYVKNISKKKVTFVTYSLAKKILIILLIVLSRTV